MKTAMKRMLDYIQAIQDDDFNSDIEYIKENCIQLMDLEKNQITEAYRKGHVDGYLNVTVEKDPEKYYAKTFEKK